LEHDSEGVLSESDSGHDEDAATSSCGNNVIGSSVHIWSRPQHPWNSDDVHPFTSVPVN